jgi:hypothetical protein
VLDKNNLTDITDYKQIDNAKIALTVDSAINSNNLTQGICSHWVFSEEEQKILEKQVKKEKITFRISGL